MDLLSIFKFIGIKALWSRVLLRIFKYMLLLLLAFPSIDKLGSITVKTLNLNIKIKKGFIIKVERRR